MSRSAGLWLGAALAALTLVAVACGDDGESDRPAVGAKPTAGIPDVPDPQPGTASVEALRESGLGYAEAFINGDSARAYSFLGSEFKVKCSLAAFAAQLVTGLAALGDLSGVEVTLTDARIEYGRGVTEADFLLDGRPIDLGGETPQEERPYWITEDGRWVLKTDDPSPCETSWPGPT